MTQKIKNHFMKYSILIILIILSSGCISAPQANIDNTRPVIMTTPTGYQGSSTVNHNPIDIERLNTSISNDPFYILE